MITDELQEQHRTDRETFLLPSKKCSYAFVHEERNATGFRVACYETCFRGVREFLPASLLSRAVATCVFVERFVCASGRPVATT